MVVGHAKEGRDKPGASALQNCIDTAGHQSPSGLSVNSVRLRRNVFRSVTS